MTASQGQLNLETPEPSNHLEREFLRWLETDDGKVVVSLAADKALALQGRGWKHYGIAAIVEAIRYDRAVQIGPDSDGYKISNNHRAYLARHLMRTRPRLAGFFTTKGLTAGNQQP